MKAWNKKILGILLCMAMVMCLLPGIGSAETDAEMATVNTGEELVSALNGASTAPDKPTLININGSFSCFQEISLESGRYAVIDLQGKTPTINNLSIRGDLTVIDTYGNGEFNMEGDLTVESSGKFTLESGKIKLNCIQISEGEVAIKDGSISGNNIDTVVNCGSGTITMTGGTIVGAGTVTGISLNNGSFTMTGGTIRNCSEGINVGASGSISISGNPVFADNTDCDIYLPEGQIINIPGQLNSTNIKVKIGGNGKGEFTRGYSNYNKETQPSTYFSSAGGFNIYLNNNGEAHMGHFHSWSYTAGTVGEAGTITATCSGPEYETCDIISGLTLILNKPSDLTYDGKPKAATLNDDYNTTAFPDEYSTIKYFKDGNSVNAADVKDVETYTAEVTAGTGAGAATAGVDFTISPKSIANATVVLEKDTLEYTGTEQSVSIKSITFGKTELTAADYDVSGNTGTDITSYTLIVTGKGNYKDRIDIIWRIIPAGMVVAADDVTAVYDAQPHGITVNVTKPESGATVKFGTEEGKYDLDESPAITDVSKNPFKIFYKVSAQNYNDYTGSAIVTINPKSIAGAKVVLENDTLECTSSPQSVTVKSVTLADGTALTADDYEVSGNTGTDAGSYTLTVTGKGNYEGTANASWTIKEKTEDESEEQTDPEDPTDPGKPNDPKNPADPGKSNDPENPADPEKPNDPENPVDPEKPNDPENPADPEKPTDPENPVDPEKPTKPENPTEPENDDPAPPSRRHYIIFTDPGKPQGGWEWNPSGWYYDDENGNEITGWLYDGENWYYMDDTGLMQTGWVYDNRNWYYLYPSGAMATGWVWDGNAWYYMNSSGKMQTGWVYDNGGWYYLYPSGVMATGWVWDGSAWYYMNSSGKMQTGWVYDNGGWYYLYPSGVMATGWILDGEYWYYLDPYTNGYRRNHN